MQDFRNSLQAKERKSSQVIHRASHESAQMIDESEQGVKSSNHLPRDRFLQRKGENPFTQLELIHLHPDDWFSKSLFTVLNPKKGLMLYMEDEGIISKGLNLTIRSNQPHPSIADLVEASQAVHYVDPPQLYQRTAWFKRRPIVATLIERYLVLLTGPSFKSEAYEQSAEPLCVETTADSLYYLAYSNLKLRLRDLEKDMNIREFKYDTVYFGTASMGLTSPEDPERFNLLLLSKGSTIKLFDIGCKNPKVGESGEAWRVTYCDKPRFFGDFGVATLNNDGNILLWDMRNLSKPASQVWQDKQSFQIGKFDFNPCDNNQIALVSKFGNLLIYDLNLGHVIGKSELPSPAVDITWRKDGQLSLIHTCPYPGLTSWRLSAQRKVINTKAVLSEFKTFTSEVYSASGWREGNLALTVGFFNFTEPEEDQFNISILKH